jgi:hypothetical protein
MLLDPAAKLISVTEENTEVKLSFSLLYTSVIARNDRNFPVVPVVNPEYRL